MIFLKIDLKKLALIPADKENESHKWGILLVFNQNIKYSYLTKKPLSIEEHNKWWETAFGKEYIYVIKYESEVCGYIRLTKERTISKEKYEISIALLEEFQKFGVGSYTYNLFENEMKKKGIPEIIAQTEFENTLGQRFFEKNKFKKILIKFKKILQNSKLS